MAAWGARMRQGRVCGCGEARAVLQRDRGLGRSAIILKPLALFHLSSGWRWGSGWQESISHGVKKSPKPLMPPWHSEDQAALGTVQIAAAVE